MLPSSQVSAHLQASTSGKGMGSQKEINLRDELDLRDRTDIYRNFLHYCMSGNVVSLPMGTTGTKQKWPTLSPEATKSYAATKPAGSSSLPCLISFQNFEIVKAMSHESTLLFARCWKGSGSIVFEKSRVLCSTSAAR